MTYLDLTRWMSANAPREVVEAFLDLHDERDRSRMVLKSVEQNGPGNTCPRCGQWPHLTSCLLDECVRGVR